jgi:hypothetical protein
MGKDKIPSQMEATISLVQHALTYNGIVTTIPKLFQHWHDFQDTHYIMTLPLV